MPYSLQSRIENALFEEEKEDFVGNPSEEEANVSEQSETESDAEETDSELKNSTQDERILENSQDARGKPRIIFHSKNKTKWSSKKPTRISGQLN